MTVSDGVALQVPGVLRSGTKEYLLVNVGDRIENVDDLSALNPTFSVYDPNDTPMQVNVPANVIAGFLMVAQCLIDTTAGGGWPSNKYRLYLSLSASPEAPILGPVVFRVEEL